jgi:hypothetical protein
MGPSKRTGQGRHQHRGYTSRSPLATISPARSPERRPLIDSTAARKSAIPSATRRPAARARKKIAQRHCNQLAHDVERAIDGGDAANFVRAGVLFGVDFDELQERRLAQIRGDETWRPKKGFDLVRIMAQLVGNWRIPATRSDGTPHPQAAFAGERWSGIYAKNAEMGAIAGCSRDQWARHTRPLLEDLGLVHGLPTTKVTRPGWRSRTGAAMPWREGRTLYVPGDALWDLLGVRTWKIARARRKLIAHSKWLLTRRQRKVYDPKALGDVITSPRSTRGPQRLVHTLLRAHQPMKSSGARTAARPRWPQRSESSPATASPQTVAELAAELAGDAPLSPEGHDEGGAGGRLADSTPKAPGTQQELDGGAGGAGEPSGDVDVMALLREARRALASPGQAWELHQETTGEGPTPRRPAATGGSAPPSDSANAIAFAPFEGTSTRPRSIDDERTGKRKGEPGGKPLGITVGALWALLPTKGQS